MTTTRRSPVPSARAAAPAEASRAIVEIARWAPSVHNTQPWSWHLRGWDLELRAERARQLWVADPEGRNLTISCGAALHYAVTGAQALGWDTDVVLRRDTDDTDLLATIRLAPGAVPPDASAALDALRRRCTDRRRFTNWPIPAERLRQLAETVRLPSLDVVALTEPVQRWHVELLTDAARRAQARDERFADEMRRWTDHDREGIPSSSLDLGASSGSNLRRRPTRFDHDEEAANQRPVHSSDGLLVIGTRDDDKSSWLRAGMAMTGLWLEATTGGLSVVPLSQVVEVPDARVQVGREVFAAGRFPQILLRIGWQEIGRAGLVRSPRRTVGELLTT